MKIRTKLAPAVLPDIVSMCGSAFIYVRFFSSCAFTCALLIRRENYPYWKLKSERNNSKLKTQNSKLKTCGGEKQLLNTMSDLEQLLIRFSPVKKQNRNWDIQLTACLGCPDG